MREKILFVSNYIYGLRLNVIYSLLVILKNRLKYSMLYR